MLWGTQGEGLRQGKGPKRSGLGAAGLKRDGPVAGGNQLACSWKSAAGEFIEERERGMEAGEKQRPGSSPQHKK